MATYFVSKDGDDSSPTTDPGTSGSWSSAYNTLAEAVTAATSAGDIIKISDEHYENLAADTTYTLANNIRILVVDHQDTATLSVMDRTNTYIGHGTSAYTIAICSTYKCYIYGVAFKMASSGIDRLSLIATSSDGGSLTLENCKLDVGTGSNASGASAWFGTASADNQTYIELRGCTLRYNNGTGQHISFGNTRAVLINCNIDTAGSAPSVFGASRFRVELHGCDLSHCTGTLFNETSEEPFEAILVNCKLGSGVTFYGSPAFGGLSGGDVILHNCSSEDIHYNFVHVNALGKTVISTATYCNDNIADVNLSWYIESTASAEFYNAYKSPWIDVYNDDISTSITPYLEGLRASDSDTDCDTVAQDDEIWSEWSVQDTANVPLAVITSDRMALLGTAANQTSTKATTDWTIAAANDAYKSCFKLAAPAAVTPNEVGHVRARVCVGIPSKGFFIDPQIRGLA